MSSEWQRVALDELYEFSSGLSKPRSAFGSGYPFLSFKDVFYNSAVPKKLTELVTSTLQERERCSVARGDVFLTRTSETMDELGMSSVALTDIPDATFNGFTKRLRPKNSKRVAPEFARYYFRSPDFRSAVTAMTSMSTRASLNNEMLSRLYMVLPSHAEQERIGQALGALDDRIILLRETNKTLESVAQAIFKSWFVDFDPVRAKMECRQPKGMDEDTAALFPDSFEEHELGVIPKSWNFSTVGESFVLTMGQSPPGDTYNTTGDGLPFYQGRTDFGFRFPSKRVFCTSPARLAIDGDTLISVRAPVGDVNMAIERCCIGRGVAAARHPLGFQGFTFYTMKELGSEFKTFDSEGTVFGSISKKDFQRLRVIIPGANLLRRFDEITAPLDSRIANNEEATRTLTSLRDSLVPRLISGQLRLPEAQEQIENALP